MIPTPARPSARSLRAIGDPSRARLLRGKGTAAVTKGKLRLVRPVFGAQETAKRER